MAGALGDRHGGIAGLLELLDEYQEAVEFDLIDRLNQRLRNIGPLFTWHDLWVFVRGLPRESAYARALLGEDHFWGLSELILAQVSDSLRILVWQQTEDGSKGKNQPKPWPRPGVAPDEDTTMFGKDAISIDEMDDWLGWSKELAEPEPVADVDKVGKPARKRDARGRFTKN